MAAVSFKQGDLFSEQDFRVVDNRIVFNNLIYDAMTGEKLPFSSTLPYTRAVNANFIEDDLPTPAYDQLRRDATGDDSTSVDMFDFMLGYLLVPNRSGKCFFCLGTAPDSGKSLILDFCVSMFGARSIPVEPEKLGGRFAFERAPSAQLLYCKDVTTEHLSPKSISQIKIASGDKEIRSEGKGKTETTAPIRFKMIFATNDKMKGKGDKPDPAFYRRMIVLPFIHSAEDHMESDMAQRLLEERDAILSHAARKLYSIIDHKGGIRIPESSLSINMKKSWYEPQDFMEYFIENVVEHAGDYKSFLSKEELYEAYENFSRVCKENGLAGSLCTSKDFNQRLLSLMDGLTYTRARTERSPENAVYGFRNIRWKTN